MLDTSVMANTLALIEVLSDTAYRAPLEAERALAEDWYRRSQRVNKVHINERPSIPDTPQPPFVPWQKWREPGQQQPQLPWRDDVLSEFPFTTTCVLLALLRDDGDANATNCNRMRPGDVQFQPLSTVFRGDCTEYGLVVLDISDLDKVKHGIVAFPMHYMAEVWYHDERAGWDPVEDGQPVKEPDVVLISPRPRVPLSIAQWMDKYYEWRGQDAHHILLRLEDRQLVDTMALDSNFQKLAEFCVQRRRRLEEVPASLGPSSEVTALILRIAYAGGTHLNWAIFRNLAPSIVVAAITSTEILAATALSICVDEFDGELGDLSLVLAQSTTLKQLCFLQRPDRNSDDTSGRFCTQQLLQGCSLGDFGWLRNKTIYSTCAFSTSLRSREFQTLSSTISGAQVFLVIHMFTFMNHQREDATDVATDHNAQKYQNSYSYSYSDYYAMDNTLLDTRRSAGRFLAYPWSLGSGSDSDEAVLRFAYKGASSSLTATTTTVDDDGHSPRHGHRQINPLVRVGDIPPGSWVVLVDRRGFSCSSSDDDDVFLQYSFVKIAPEQQQQRPIPVPNPVEVVGGLTNFLRETAPGRDVSTWEEQIKKVERDLHMRRAPIERGKHCIGICVMAESSAHTSLNQLL